MPSVAFEIGPISIYWYSIILLLAITIAFIIVNNEAKRFDIPQNFIVDLLFYGVIIGMIGARIYYVFFRWDYYGKHLIDILKVWEGGLAVHGGIIFGLIWIVFYSKKMRVKVLRMLDIIVVGLILAQSIGRWGNYFNQEAFGPLVNYEKKEVVISLTDEQLNSQKETLKKYLIPNFVIERMYITPAINSNAKMSGYYHPTFWYESIWCLIGFVILLFIRRLKYLKIGQLTCTYLIWYGIGRYFIESMRTDSLMFYNIKVAQMVSITMIIVGIVLIFIYNKGSKFKNQYKDIGETIDVRKK